MGKNGIRSCWEYSCGKVAITTIAHNENDGGIGFTRCNLLGDPAGASG
jgi:hypothetical protein